MPVHTADNQGSAPAVVVGVDGSAAATRAALWALDLAIDYDAALRLVYAIGTDAAVGPDRDDTSARLHATGQRAIDEVIRAVEAVGKPVKIDVDITCGPPASVLVGASRSAALACVGAVGSHHFQPGRVGSTAAALAVRAHCPVAIIAAHDQPSRVQDPVILVEIDDSPDNGVVLEAALEHARLRNTSLRVITCWQAPHVDQRAREEVDRQLRARLARQLAPWRHRYPNLRIEEFAVHGSALDYLTRNAGTAQLFIVGAGDAHHVSEVVGPAGTAALGGSGCAILVVNRRHL